MAEQLNNMKDAVVGGRGGGLQGVSTAVGDVMSGKQDTRSGSEKKTDEASASLGEFGKDSGTTQGTSVSAKNQLANQKSGSADHLNLGGKDT